MKISTGKKIFKIAEQVQKLATHYTLTEKGKPKAVMMSAEEFESWQETLEVMHDFPNLEKDIKELKNDVKSGAYKKYITLEEILAKKGFSPTNKITKKNDLPREIKARGRERVK